MLSERVVTYGSVRGVPGDRYPYRDRGNLAV